MFHKDLASKFGGTSEKHTGQLSLLEMHTRTVCALIIIFLTDVFFL
jgi:hypothetical protein